MNQDEAATGYEAWALLKHGIDRNGYAWPVHFVSWGNGQNALYSYLMLPFIAAFDLTVFSMRLPMALSGVASLLLFWRIAARARFAGGSERDTPEFALLALLLLAACPWHIMLSRWGLEPNVLPFIILLAVYLLTRCDNHRLSIQSAAVFTLSLSVYAYGTAYFFAPLFLALVFVWLRLQGKLPLRHLIALGALALLVTLPIILLLAINTFGWESIRAGISIPKYTGIARYEEQSTMFSGRFFAQVAEQWLFIVKLLSVTDPRLVILVWNKMPGYALLFPLASVPLAFGFGVTIYRALKHREIGVHLLFALWLVAAFATAAVTVVNINRVNVVWLPAVYFAALGVFYACRRMRVLLPPAMLAALCYGGLFAHAYFTRYNDFWIFPDTGQVFAQLLARAAADDKIYITHSGQINAAYIHALFHTQTPPQEFVKTRDIPEPDAPYQQVASFGRFIFTPARMGEADHLLLLRNYAGNLSGSAEEIAAINAAGVAACAREDYGRFALLHCK